MCQHKMRNRTSDYGAARVCKGINLRGREAYATVPNIGKGTEMKFKPKLEWQPG